MHRYLIFIFIFTCLVRASGFFSEIQQNSRQQGMGGAFTGLADDGEAVYYNPAGLINLRNIEVITMYSRQLAHLEQGDQETGINVNYIGYAQNLGDVIGSFGVRYYNRRYSFGDVFSAGEHIIILGYGRKLTDLIELYPDIEWLQPLKNLSMGAGFKFMNSGFYDAEALGANPYVGDDNISNWTWSMNISLYYKLMERYSFGFMFKDFNRPDMSMVSENSQQLDKMDYSFGFAYKYSSNLQDVITFDLESENADYGLNFGTEKFWKFEYKNAVDEFILRSGVRIGFEKDYHWSLGFGYLLTDLGRRMDFDMKLDLRFDYAFKIMTGEIGDGPANHSFQLVFLSPFTGLR